ncbi:hypothetical protein FKM82_009023 [Ascaphus truei]
MTECWRLFLCKELGSSSCFAAQRSPNEDEAEENDHQVVVSDILQLVPDDQSVLDIQEGERNE